MDIDGHIEVEIEEFLCTDDIMAPPHIIKYDTPKYEIIDNKPIKVRVFEKGWL